MLVYFHILSLLTVGILAVAYGILFVTHYRLIGGRNVIVMSRIRIEDLYFLPILSLPSLLLTVLFYYYTHAGLRRMLLLLIPLSVTVFFLLALYDRRVMLKRSNRIGIEYYGAKLPGLACVSVVTAFSLEMIGATVLDWFKGY